MNEREGDKARAIMHERTRRLINGLREMGYTIPETPDSPNVRVNLGVQPNTTKFLKKFLGEERIIVTPALYPVVEWRNTGFRFMVTALHCRNFGLNEKIENCWFVIYYRYSDNYLVPFRGLSLSAVLKFFI